MKTITLPEEQEYDQDLYSGPDLGGWFHRKRHGQTDVEATEPRKYNLRNAVQNQD